MFSGLGLVELTVTTGPGSEEYVEFNNLTIINLLLKFTGPMHEKNVTLVLLCFQIFCSLVAFMVRYPLAYLLFGEIVV